MLRRLALVCALLAFAGCQNSTPSPVFNAPSSPTATQPLPVVPQSQPPAQPPAPAPILAADWDITFSAAAPCDDIPAALRTRTYAARFEAVNGWSTVVLSGAEFYSRYDTFFLRERSGLTRFWVSSLYAMQQWLEDQPIFERLAEGGFLALMGTADISIDLATSSSTSRFIGSFDYCPLATEPNNPDFPPSCPKLIRCDAGALKLVKH